MSIVAGVLNSASVDSSTVATLNITPATDAAYSVTKVLYKKHGASSWTVYGSTYTGTQGVAGNFTVTASFDPSWYQFCVVTSDTSGRLSLPSNIKTAKNETYIAEENLFVENTIVLLSNCPSFQSFTNTTTAETARQRIFDREFSEITDSKYFPMAVIYYDNAVKSAQIDTSTFISSCNLNMTFVSSCSSEHERNDKIICREFMDLIGPIIQEMKSLQGIDLYLNINNLDMVSNPYFAMVEDNKDETQDLVMVDFTIQAGFII